MRSRLLARFYDRHAAAPFEKFRGNAQARNTPAEYGNIPAHFQTS